MQEADLFKVFLSRFNGAGFDYMITGSVACIIYGKPRMTHDIDLVLNITISQIENFAAFFPFDEFYCPPTEVIRTENLREARGHFNIIHHASGFKADIYPVGHDELIQWGLANKKQFDLKGETIWVAPPEYVIIQKLRYYQEGRSWKHLTDIRGLLETSVQSTSDQLYRWIDQYELHKEWETVCQVK